VDRAIGPDRSIRRTGQPPLAPGQIDLLLDSLAVVWMYASDHVLGGRRHRIRLETKKTPHIARPQQNVSLEIPLPGAGLRELLRSFVRRVARALGIRARPERQASRTVTLSRKTL
jgi:hypothetical protein